MASEPMPLSTHYYLDRDGLVRMLYTVRDLTIDDHEQVRELSATIWDGNDYVGETFPRWIEREDAFVYGIFDGTDLIAVATLDQVSGTKIAWVEGLRVKDSYRGQGLATRLVHHIVEQAKSMGIEILWYATGSRNEASQLVAENTGFTLATRVGYAGFEAPYPQHPSPSPNIVPLTVNAERLHSLLQENPDLIDTERIPLAWSFDFPTIDGLRRLGRETDFKVIIDDDGRAIALYYSKYVGHDERTRGAYTVYASDRTAFVDVMARILDEIETRMPSRAAVFLGPRVKEWSKHLGFIDKQYEKRSFLLYEQRFGGGSE